MAKCRKPANNSLSFSVTAENKKDRETEKEVHNNSWHGTYYNKANLIFVLAS